MKDDIFNCKIHMLLCYVGELEYFYTELGFEITKKTKAQEKFDSINKKYEIPFLEAISLFPTGTVIDSTNSRLHSTLVDISELRERIKTRICKMK